MKRVTRDGIFAFVIAGLIGAYTYVLGLNNGTKETASETETSTDNDSTEESSTEEELSED